MNNLRKRKEEGRGKKEKQGVEREALVTRGKSEEPRWRSVFREFAIGVARTDLKWAASGPPTRVPENAGWVGYTRRNRNSVNSYFSNITMRDIVNPNWISSPSCRRKAGGNSQVEKQLSTKDGSLIW